MSHTIIIVLILFTAGFLGGITNYFRIEQEKNGYPFWKNLLMGTCASLLIPLFLNMISSNLISESSSDGSKLFVLFGFCLVASLSSETFIQSISKRLLDEVRKAKEDTAKFKRDIEPILSKETEPIETDDVKNRTFDFDDDTKKVIGVLGGSKYAWRTPSGIGREIGLEREIVLKLLEILESKRLVVMTHKKGRFGLTSDGRVVYLRFFPS